MANTNEGAAGIVGATAELEKAICTASIKALKKALVVLEIQFLGAKDLHMENVVSVTIRLVETKIASRSNNLTKLKTV